jgi:hypothetical protein
MNNHDSNVQLSCSGRSGDAGVALGFQCACERNERPYARFSRPDFISEERYSQARTSREQSPPDAPIDLATAFQSLVSKTRDKSQHLRPPTRCIHPCMPRASRKKLKKKKKRFFVTSEDADV